MNRLLPFFTDSRGRRRRDEMLDDVIDKLEDVDVICERIVEVSEDGLFFIRPSLNSYVTDGRRHVSFIPLDAWTPACCDVDDNLRAHVGRELKRIAGLMLAAAETLDSEAGE